MYRTTLWENKSYAGCVISWDQTYEDVCRMVAFIKLDGGHTMVIYDQTTDRLCDLNDFNQAEIDIEHVL